MKTIFKIPVLAVLLAFPNPCFALWDLMSVSRKEAKELGMEIRSKTNGTSESVELEFKTQGVFKHFSREDYEGSVVLQIREGKTRLLSATLKEDRLQPGRVVVSFHADRSQLDKLTLQVLAPYRDGGLGGAIYEIRVKEFVEPGKAPPGK
jgi:hypothetical protein